LPLAFLAPDITKSILTGTQPIDLTAERLKRIGKLPACWNEQRRVLSMPNQFPYPKHWNCRYQLPEGAVPTFWWSNTPTETRRVFATIRAPLLSLTARRFPQRLR
jgi:hypothetical protein